MPMPASTNVQVTGIPVVPSSATPASMNNILFLTTNQPLLTALNATPYKVYSNATSVGIDYGTTSSTYLIAQVMFSQNPNFTLGNGQLTIAPLLSAINATYGIFTTQTLTANIANFQTVSNGGFKINASSEGGTYEVDGLNFTGIQTVSDIAAVIQNGGGLPPLYQYLNSAPSLNSVSFTSRVPGSLSVVTMSSPATIGVTDLTGSSLLGNALAGISVTGINSSGESLGIAVTRLKSLSTPPNFNAVITNLIMDATAILAFAVFCQAGYEGQPLEWGYCFTSIDNCTPITGTCSQIVTLGYSKTRMNLDFLNVSSQLCAAYNSTLRSVNINTSNSYVNGIPNLSKSLTGMLPNVVDLNELSNTILPAGTDMYLNVANTFGIARPSNANGGQFNTIYFGDTILLQIQNDLISVLSTQTIAANPQGDTLLSSTVRGTMIKVLTSGMITPGVWSSAIPPGVPDNQSFINQIAQYGFYVFVPSYTTRTPAEILAGQTPPILVACNLTGGINVVIVNVFEQQN